MDRLIYTPRERIPLFRLVKEPGRAQYAEFQNQRTGRVEQCSVSSLIVFLFDAEMAACEEAKMLYSPGGTVPLGMLRRDRTGVYLDVKYKNRREAVRLTTYVAKLLDDVQVYRKAC